MAAAITELRASLKDTLESEFAAEGLTVRNDKLHDSMGTETPLGAVYPEGERVHTSKIVGMFIVAIQVFQRWDPQIDPAQIVDPADIEAWAWRLQRRMLDDSAVNAPNLTYYVPDEVLYPDDPTGNKSRFVMTVVGYGHQPGMVETSA